MKRLVPFMLVMLATGCHKNASNDEHCGSAGFIAQYSRVFWKAKDFGGGEIAIEITRQNGSKAVEGYLKNSWPSGGVDCSYTSGVVSVKISIGEGASWRASDAAGHTWSGAIPSTCEKNSCQTIEIR